MAIHSKINILQMAVEIAADKRSTFMSQSFLSMKCSAYGQMDAGRAKDHNEDNIRLNPDHMLFILADGMGGHEAGEVASQMAVDTVENTLLRHHNGHQQFDAAKNYTAEISETCSIAAAVKKTNIAIHKENTKRGFPDGKGMGTTLVGCWYLPEEKVAVIFNVGDSRAYSYYKQELTQVSKDHSLLQLWKDGQLQQKEKPAANRLTRALGPYAKVEADILIHNIKKDEKIILCSDGLTTMVSDEKILAALIENEKAAEKLPEILIKKANQAGGEDNISVIIITFS